MHKMKIADSLYNCSSNCVKSQKDIDYGRGILVGLVSGIMAGTGCTWKTAIDHVNEANGQGIKRECIPESWQEHIDNIT